MSNLRPALRQQGFTLIEILVVVFIIGLTAGMVALSIGDKKDETGPRKEAELLLQQIDYVSEYASLNGEMVGMYIQPKDSSEGVGRQWCYHWQRLREGGWTDMPEDTLTEHCMDENLQWDLVVEGHTWAYEPELEVQPPVLIFSPSGESTAVDMGIYSQGEADSAQRIEIDLMGSVHWRNQEEEEKTNGR